MDVHKLSRTIMWPNRLIFGEASAMEIGPEAARFSNGPVLIVTDRGVVESDILEPVEASLRDAGLRVSAKEPSQNFTWEELQGEKNAFVYRHGASF